MKTGRKYPFKKKAPKRKRNGRHDGKDALEDKVADRGGRTGFGLEVSTEQESDQQSGVYGNRSVVSASSVPRIRLFQTPSARKSKTFSTGKNDALGDGNEKPLAHQSGTKSTGDKSNFSLSSRTTKNPYQGNSRLRRTRPLSSSNSQLYRAQAKKLPTAAVHIVCAISENLARETCVSSLDAGSPVALHITKQGNSQTYAETLAYLEVLKPDEILLNEGRRNSQLARKILTLYNMEHGTENPIESQRDRSRQKGHPSAKNTRGYWKDFTGSSTRCNIADEKDKSGSAGNRDPCETSTVVKFVPRSYFDQTKGAELLRRIARNDTYDTTVDEEYILLSSSYAVLQYTQLCLGANFARNSLDMTANSGGNNRMSIDRSTLLNLELLANSKTGKMANSLVGSVDCTKTNVGSRLLRTNLMAPPTRVDTINARLDLVDTLLEDEEFFYVVMEHLEALPDVEKMLTNIVLVPWKKSKSTNAGEEVTARIASKGISALVCMKSTLTAIPAFASILEDQLNTVECRDRTLHLPMTDGGRSRDAASTRSTNDPSNTASASIALELSENDGTNDATSEVTDDNSLLIGLGSGPATIFSTKDLRHQLLRAILLTMKQPALTEVLNAVADIFTESTTFSRNSHAMRHQECFALKPNTNGMMDVLRKAFLANVDDIYRLADEYAESYSITVTVKETTNRGYYLAVPVGIATELPDVFIQPVKSGRFIQCTTEEVHSLNARAQESVRDLLIMTHERIQEVLDVARSRYDVLASLSDAIALLDMCHCFADNVASSRLPWCRPTVTDGPTLWETDQCTQGEMMPRGSLGGDIAIKNGRYGINVTGTGLTMTDLSSAMVSDDFVPNDTYASEFQNFTVVTGVNGSGKSTYLKQIAIIAVLAHCGSYVPAEEAFIPIRDRICTRIGTADDQEHNISTFMLEMKETAFICNNASMKSLILVDELGRATSNEDGVAIAWAVAEFLLEKRAMTFFVTHYPQLCRLADVYPTVQNQHMGATAPGTSQTDILYTHKILPGPCKMAADYGVEMAATCGWPHDVVTEARSIRELVDTKLPDGALCQIESETRTPLNIVRRKAGEHLQTLACHLIALKDCNAKLSLHAKRGYLQDLRVRLIPQGDSQLVDNIKNLLLEGPDENLPSIPLLSEALNSNGSASDPTDSPTFVPKAARSSAVVNSCTETKENQVPSRASDSSPSVPQFDGTMTDSIGRDAIQHNDKNPLKHLDDAITTGSTIPSEETAATEVDECSSTTSNNRSSSGSRNHISLSLSKDAASERRSSQSNFLSSGSGGSSTSSSSSSSSSDSDTSYSDD